MKSPAHRTVTLAVMIGLCAIGVASRAAIPPALANAVQELRAQKSYSWEVINADPGPVAQSTDTRRGRVTTVQQNLAPHIKGRLATTGDLLLKREWPDGLRLDTVVSATGQVVTLTPEGWLTNQEILTLIAEERISSSEPSGRLAWLRRADRPDMRRPDEELSAAVRAAESFEVSGDTYVARIRIAPNTRERSGLSALAVTLTLNLRSGVVRNYQLTVQGARAVARVGIEIPLSDDRFVILSYLPISKLDVPDEAWAKLKAQPSLGR
jgi:hypothetical protein